AELSLMRNQLVRISAECAAAWTKYGEAVSSNRRQLSLITEGQNIPQEAETGESDRGIISASLKLFKKLRFQQRGRARETVSILPDVRSSGTNLEMDGIRVECVQLSASSSTRSVDIVTVSGDVVEHGVVIKLAQTLARSRADFVVLICIRGRRLEHGVAA